MKAKAYDIELRAILDFIPGQCKDKFCDQVNHLVERLIYFLKVANNGLLMRQALFDGLTQKLVPVNLGTTVLYLAHHYSLAGHSYKRQM